MRGKTFAQDKNFKTEAKFFFTFLNSITYSVFLTIKKAGFRSGPIRYAGREKSSFRSQVITVMVASMARFYETYLF